MKTFLPLLVLSCLTALGCASSPSGQQPASAELDYGDQTSVTLQVKAWEALNAGQLENAIKYTERCADIYATKAREMQSALTAKPKAENVHDYWALNDVGTCYFIRGEALMKLHRSSEAMAAYQTVIDEYRYAQAWDPKGWFWSPADAVSQKIEILKYRKTGDF